MQTDRVVKLATVRKKVVNSNIITCRLKELVTLTINEIKTENILVTTVT